MTFTNILKRPEAASYAKLSVPTMDRLRVTGGGPAYVKIGSAVRYRKTDLDAWLASRVVRSTSEAGE